MTEELCGEILNNDIWFETSSLSPVASEHLTASTYHRATDVVCWTVGEVRVRRGAAGPQIYRKTNEQEITCQVEMVVLFADQLSRDLMSRPDGAGV